MCHFGTFSPLEGFALVKKPNMKFLLFQLEVYDSWVWSIRMLSYSFYDLIYCKSGRHWLIVNDSSLINLCIHSHLKMWEWFWTMFQKCIAEVVCIQVIPNWRCRNMISKVKPLTWAISRYVVNRIPSLFETNCAWCTGAFHCFNIVLALRIFLDMQVLPRNKGYMLITKTVTIQGLLDNLGKPVL